MITINEDAERILYGMDSNELSDLIFKTWNITAIIDEHKDTLVKSLSEKMINSYWVPYEKETIVNVDGKEYTLEIEYCYTYLGSWVCTVKELPGCGTQAIYGPYKRDARSYEALIENAKDAIREYLLAKEHINDGYKYALEAREQLCGLMEKMMND